MSRSLNQGSSISDGDSTAKALSREGLECPRKNEALCGPSREIFQRHGETRVNFYIHVRRAIRAAEKHCVICSLPRLPWWLNGKESACQGRRSRSNPWVEKIPWRRKWQPTPVFLPGKSHGQKSLVGYSLRSQKSQT